MDIEALARLESPQGSLVSVYLNRPPGASAAALTDVLKPLRADLDSFPRPVAMSIRNDAERIAALASRIDVDSAPAHCIFASHADDFFEFRALPAPAWDHASVGRRPYLRPIRALPETLHAGVVVAERQRAVVYRADDGALEEIGPPIVVEPGKDNFGGFKGYAEHGARARADEEAARVLKMAAARLFERHQDQPFDFLSFGGHQETVEDVVRHLHPYLRSIPHFSFVIDPHTMSAAELRNEVAGHASRLRAIRDEHAVTEALEAVNTGMPSALGTRNVLEAANAHAIDLLVVAGTYAKPGVRCHGCGWLGRDGAECPGCGGPLEVTEDVVADAMEAVIASGGTVRQVGVASQLDADGVAAALRFPV